MSLRFNISCIFYYFCQIDAYSEITMYEELFDSSDGWSFSGSYTFPSTNILCVNASSCLELANSNGIAEKTWSFTGYHDIHVQFNVVSNGASGSFAYDYSYVAASGSFGSLVGSSGSYQATPTLFRKDESVFPVWSDLPSFTFKLKMTGSNSSVKIYISNFRYYGTPYLTASPTKEPTRSGSQTPTTDPSKQPTTSNPTDSPTNNHITQIPTPLLFPLVTPTTNPTNYPSDIPTNNPITSSPTYTPTPSPTNIPTNVPIQEGQVQNQEGYLTTKSPKQIQTNSDTLRVLFIIFIIFAAVIVVGCILFFIYRNKGKSMSVAKERHIGIELNSMSTPRVLAVSGEDIDNMTGMTTSGDVDQNDEEKEVTFMAMLSVARIQCAQELMVSAIEERYKIELEEEGDMDDSVDDVKGEYLQEGKNVYGLRENKTTNDGSTCTKTGAANDVNNQNEK